MTRSRVILAAACALLPLGLVGAAWAQQGAPAPRPDLIKVDHPGHALFDQHCAACHGAGSGDDGSAMLPGTATLSARYQGALPGELELRDDLDGDALRLFVRRGVGSMPSFRKAELSDAEIDAIAAYLAASAAANPRPED